MKETRLRCHLPTVSWVLLTLFTLIAGLLSATAPTASADEPTFNPGYIISDENYYGLNMTVDEIQAFLNEKGAGCSGNQCLKTVTATTANIPGDEYCSGYVSEGTETAAQIIYKSAKSCGISPKVMLVSIEKESGMVSTTSPTARRYNALTGYACPESGCNSDYAGLFNQIYYGMEGFQKWGKASGYRYKAGQTTTIAYHPNSACGSLPVTIQNAPTAALYNYTPYVPNEAALAAGSGLGDSCSSYGNRNFWLYWVKWFGDPTQPDPAVVAAREKAAAEEAARVAAEQEAARLQQLTVELKQKHISDPVYECTGNEPAYQKYKTDPSQLEDTKTDPVSTVIQVAFATFTTARPALQMPGVVQVVS